MARWTIESSAGVYMGRYDGETEREALDAYAQDAGYVDYEEVMNTVGGSPIVTQETAQEILLRVARMHGHDEAIQLIMESENCTDADIDEDGDVWIERGGFSCWIRDEDRIEKIAEFMVQRS